MDAFFETARERFDSGATRDVGWRLRKLSALRSWIVKNESRISDALFADLAKGAHESYMTETGLVLSEISFVCKNLRKWAKRRAVKTPLALFPGRSFSRERPFGPVLILSPWNYPFLLSVEPLVSALSAGNTAVLKPSSKAPNVSRLFERMVAEVFPDGEVSVAIGGHELSDALLSEPFGMIFFTGSAAVGRHVLELAARNLTPAVLELGGKSPCVVDASADLEVAARRIAFGKLVNAGQTCVAPDFALVDSKVKGKFETLLAKEFESADLKCLPKIVDDAHLKRLERLVEGEKVLCGGRAFGGKFLPTVLSDVSFDSPVMREEIFGPILPVIGYASEGELIPRLSRMPSPLAFYVFSSQRSFPLRLQESLSFGAMTVNDTLMHIASPHLPFGGVGESGMGRYHGYAGFKAFSREVSFLERGTWPDIPFRYPPFSAWKSKLVHFFLR